MLRERVTKAPARVNPTGATTKQRRLERELAWRGRSEWQIRREMEAAVQRRFSSERGMAVA